MLRSNSKQSGVPIQLAQNWFPGLAISNAKTTTTTLHAFNGLFSRTTWVSRYQKCKTSLDLNEARDDEVMSLIICVMLSDVKLQYLI